MSLWVLVAVFQFGSVVETDLFYTKAQCERWVKWAESMSAKARCELVTVKK